MWYSFLVPKVERRTPVGQSLALQKMARDVQRRLALAMAQPVELSGGGIVRVPCHQRCCGCERWLVKGTGATKATYGYLCSGCMEPEPPEDVRLVEAFDTVARGGS
jgi:hypothetical protein